MKTRRARLQVTVTDGAGRRTSAARGLSPWLIRAAPRAARGLISIALVSNAHMRRLNREYLGHDYATDVLTFPAGPRTAHRGPRTDSGPRTPHSGQPPLLGDIAIALGVAGRQTREFGHSRAVEVRILALHGLLHLLGYDHETDRGEMRRLEEQLRRRAGLPVGLIARTPGR